MKDRWDKWVPAEAPDLAQLRESFVGGSPFPHHFLRFDRMMNEFFNDYESSKLHRTLVSARRCPYSFRL